MSSFLYLPIVIIAFVGMMFGKTLILPLLRQKLGLAKPPDTIKKYGPEAYEACSKALQGDWPALIQFLKRSSNVDVKSNLLRELLFDTIDPFNHRQLVAHLGTFEGELLDAHVQQAIAWTHRGHGAPPKHGSQRSNAYHGGLQVAIQRAQKAAELNPTDPLPWILLIDLFRDEDRSRGEAAFREAVRLAPSAFTPYRRFQARYKIIRWGADEEEMFSFARECAANAPPGDLRHAMIAMAHREVWDYPREFERDRADSLVHIQKPEVQSEVAAACERSVLVPDIPMDPNRREAIETFASWFYIVGDKEKCRHLMQMMSNDGELSRHWRVLGAAVEDAKDWCFKDKAYRFKG